MSAGLYRAGYQAIRQIPLADGGEGTLAVLMQFGGRRHTAMVTGPTGALVSAEWGELDNGTAVVEMAAASGLNLIAPGKNDAVGATSAGTGELIRAALAKGARRVIVGVGGSACTDGGLGAIEALGWSLAGVEVIVACDVRTEFVDAARTFAPQKGASPEQVLFLEHRLHQLSAIYRSRTGRAVDAVTSGGAAGGLAGGLYALGAKLVPGAPFISDLCGLPEAVASADLIVTGEGRLDDSSLNGKVVGNVLSLSSVRNCTAVIVGSVDPDMQAKLPESIKVASVVDQVSTATEAFERAAEIVANLCAALPE